MGDAHDELSTVDLRRFDPTPPPRVSFSIHVLTESDRGASITVDGSSAGRVYVGKGEGCELRLTDPSVSRRHLALEIEGDCLRVLDAGSTNGTFVGGTRIRDCFLSGGETIRVGSITLQVERRSATAARLSSATAFGRLRGASREMRRIYPVCERLAATVLPILVEGETGTGKEVLAESIHEASPRASGPFVVLDCTAVAPNLVESFLFGHEKGAFTGASSQHVGVFEEAHGGTLFIDEIGDLDATMQPKLLRAIERSEIRRVGGSRWLHVDVRILAATRRDLDAEIEAGRFRDDLFHRLAIARIELPPLRVRRGDVAFLTEEFCRQEGATLASIPPDVLAAWERASWPGNVRELRNEVARFLALGELSMDAMPSGRIAGDFVESVLAADLPIGTARQRVVEDFERRYVERVLAMHDGNVSRAAQASGLARRYFQILRAKTKRSD
jgi:DNA-binding NtrC family response regulator